MMYYHTTPRENLASIAKHGLLCGRCVRELGIGDLTSMWEDGANYIHVTDDLDRCAHWCQNVFRLKGIRVASSWYFVRFDPLGLDIEVRPDPRSQTGLILVTDRIPPEILEHRFGEDYGPGQGEECWRPMAIGDGHTN